MEEKKNNKILFEGEYEYTKVDPSEAKKSYIPICEHYQICPYKDLKELPEKE